MSDLSLTYKIQFTTKVKNTILLNKNPLEFINEFLKPLNLRAEQYKSFEWFVLLNTEKEASVDDRIKYFEETYGTDVINELPREYFFNKLELITFYLTTRYQGQEILDIQIY